VVDVGKKKPLHAGEALTKMERAKRLELLIELLQECSFK